jgi:hypothetical protein
VVAYDQSADLALGSYYACIFERAGLRSTPKLLMKGVHQVSGSDAIKALLHTLSRDVGNKISAALRTYQMRSREWRASCDFTTKTDNGGASSGASSGMSSRIGTRLSQLVRNEDSPPAYRK